MNQFKNPTDWAKATVKRLGWKEAHTICMKVGRPLIGLDNDTANPHYNFYKAASIWIKKNSPQEL